MTDYEQGRAARRAGLPFNANPFGDPFGSSMARSWAEGWRDSDAMLRALGLA